MTYLRCQDARDALFENFTRNFAELVCMATSDRFPIDLRRVSQSLQIASRGHSDTLRALFHCAVNAADGIHESRGQGRKAFCEVPRRSLGAPMSETRALAKQITRSSCVLGTRVSGALYWRDPKADRITETETTTCGGKYAAPCSSCVSVCYINCSFRVHSEECSHNLARRYPR